MAGADKENPMKRIINFSGGKSSALMTILEYNPETDCVVFCDTGREHEKTYKFIADFEAFEGISVVRLGGADAYNEMLARDGKKNGLPNMMKRFCTTRLKVRVARKWARENIGMTYANLIGFRADEPQRVAKNKKRWQKVEQVFPLYDRGITRANVNQYWLTKPYTLEIPHILGNCTLCFMKGQNAIINILRHDPALAAPWIEDERKSALMHNPGYTYLNGIRIEQLLQIAQMPDLFSEKSLEEINPAFDCACTA